jgi:hypothetical protein
VIACGVSRKATEVFLQEGALYVVPKSGEALSVRLNRRGACGTVSTTLHFADDPGGRTTNEEASEEMGIGIHAGRVLGLFSQSGIAMGRETVAVRTGVWKMASDMVSA